MKFKGEKREQEMEKKRRMEKKVKVFLNACCDRPAQLR
jgi:hypothetical protein